MTDRYHTLTVVLEKDTRTDDAEALINAIRMLKGVISVDGVVSDFDSHMAYSRVRSELSDELLAVLHPEIFGDKKK